MTGADDDSSVDRELAELTSELRVIIPGVTVLFGFLVTVPFGSTFDEITGADRAAYLLAFLSCACAIVLLVGESAYHRLRGKPYDKAQMVRTASRQAVGAIALLTVALSAVVFLVTDVLYSEQIAVAVGGLMLVLCVVTWFGLPLARRLRGPREGR